MFFDAPLPCPPLAIMAKTAATLANEAETRADNIDAAIDDLVAERLAEFDLGAQSYTLHYIVELQQLSQHFRNRAYGLRRGSPFRVLSPRRLN